MRARKRNLSNKRESILDAAQQAFIDEGYDNASMDRIAEIAGASKRTVYNHFPSKENLFQHVLERIMAESIGKKQIRYDSNQSLEAQLERFADAKMEILQNPAWLGMWKVTLGVFMNQPDLVRETVLRAEDQEDYLATWLSAAHNDGRLFVPNPSLSAVVFWAMMGGAFFWPALLMGPMDIEEAEPIKEELIQMFLARYRR